MNALFKLQPDWVNKKNKKTIQELYKIMQSGGMTKEEYDACIYNTELENEILEGVMEAQNQFNLRSDELDSLEKELEDLESKHYSQNMKFQSQKANTEVLRFLVEAENAHADQSR